jgi:hypothetical protein
VLPLPLLLSPLPLLLHLLLPTAPSSQVAFPSSQPTAQRLRSRTTALPAPPPAAVTALLVTTMALLSAWARTNSVFATADVLCLKLLPTACLALPELSLLPLPSSDHPSSLAPTSTAATARLSSSKGHALHGHWNVLDSLTYPQPQATKCNTWSLGYGLGHLWIGLSHGLG